MNAALDLNTWVRQWRAPMLRFAQLHLQPREDAEEAVQDALEAFLASGTTALQAHDFKAYLFGILKHKITDRLRQKYRHAERTEALDNETLDKELFDHKGHWQDTATPSTWANPEAALQHEQFFAVVDACLNHLPTKAARVFSMKELLDCDAAEVCVTLGLSKADYWQCMSRARKQLQLCLTQRWFEGSRS